MKLSALHDKLVGTWTGTMTLHTAWLPVKEHPSNSTLTVTPIAMGTFLSLAYDWHYEGKRKEGFMIVGNPNDDEAVTMAWVDSWHQSAKVMHLAGTMGDDGVAKVHGTFPAPPDPDWGWRIEVSLVNGAPRVAMFVITPDGKEGPAVDSVYARA